MNIHFGCRGRTERRSRCHAILSRWGKMDCMNGMRKVFLLISPNFCCLYGGVVGAAVFSVTPGFICRKLEKNPHAAQMSGEMRIGILIVHKNTFEQLFGFESIPS
ncbi:hypothetical protein CEXT_574351 [Caerostris extrusa]|uniref:Uncharacterized protein n=1 Tax=Caerostris extrusa TaxID=172846 RepID=A0AAV4XBN6_CAEEX|nr:hypothetical protein CEXT_574351 [Caerostris extrusa]